MDRPDGRVVLKYALIQVPGIAAAVLIAGALYRWLGLPYPAAVAGVVLWVVKDIVMFFITWRSYTGAGPADCLMTGLEGEVLEELAPAGRVRVRGENWAARTTDPGTSIKEGTPVTVKEMDGLTLVVIPRRPAP